MSSLPMSSLPISEPNVKYPLRRSNASSCTCGTCYSCCSDLLFWNVVKTHRNRREQVRIESMARNTMNPTFYPLKTIPICDCIFCIRAGDVEVPTNLPELPPPRGPTHLRRHNNCECLCMVCGSCVDNYVYFNVVESHRNYIPDCGCMYCTSEQDYQQRRQMRI